MSESCDFIVIGGGSAGYAGASAAAALGLKTAIVEGGEEVGGLCILRGCMPSKTLLESGHRALAIRQAGTFGLDASFHGADGVAIRARKRRLIGEFAEYRRDQLEQGQFELVRGRARFVDATTIEITHADASNRRMQGRAFLLATGSHVGGPRIEGLEETGFWTSDDLLDAEQIPRSVCILGGGAVGLEFASYYAGLGVTTTVIQRSAQVLKEMDEDVTEALAAAFEDRGIAVYRETRLIRAARGAAGKTVEFAHRERVRTVEAEQIIYALGRTPAIEGLDLERAGVSFNRSGVIAEPTQQCGAPHLFAAGDVCGPHQVVHLAVEQGQIAARNAARVLGALGGELERINYDLNLFVCFTHPEVAAVGLTERECAARGRPVKVAKYAFADHGKALVRGAPEGFVKLIAERSSRRLIGGACIGADAAELIHEIAVALSLGATAGDLARVPHYHPTLSEIWSYPAEELAER